MSVFNARPSKGLKITATHKRTSAKYVAYTHYFGALNIIMHYRWSLNCFAVLHEPCSLSHSGEPLPIFTPQTLCGKLFLCPVIFFTNQLPINLIYSFAQSLHHTTFCCPFLLSPIFWKQMNCHQIKDMKTFFFKAFFFPHKLNIQFAVPCFIHSPLLFRFHTVMNRFPVYFIPPCL